MLVHTHPSLVFSPCFYLLLRYSLPICFLLSNAGCGSHYYQIPRSADSQARLSIISHFSSFKIPTLCDFSSDVRVPLWETNIFLSHNSLCPVSHSHATLINDPSISMSLILSYFLRMWMWDTHLSYLPFSHACVL
jgi:hypothetical protein